MLQWGHIFLNFIYNLPYFLSDSYLIFFFKTYFALVEVISVN